MFSKDIGFSKLFYRSDYIGPELRMHKDTSMQASSRDQTEKVMGASFTLIKKKRELAKYESRHKRR
jgi:hypothetical protein